MALTALAVDNADLLRRLADPLSIASKTALADELGRDRSNLNKTIGRLIDDGLVDPLMLALTPAGDEMIAALDRADGGAQPATSGIQRAPHTAFVRNPDNPRKAFDDDETLDLARAIAGAQDVLQAIIAYPPDPEGDDASAARMLADGERRWLAVTLLAEGKVEGCTLPPLLDPRLGGGIPFTTRERTEAENAAQAAYLALIANTGKLLDPLEDGQALLTVMTARQWSAREAAFQLGRVGKTTGEAGAGTTGVKTVQERVKVAREASDENKARYRTDPEFTWKDLLASVQATKPAADGLSSDADPKDPCVYNGERFPNATMAGEARRRREGGGGASSPGRPKPAEAAEAARADQGIATIGAGAESEEEAVDQIEIPGFLRRLAGPPVEARSERTEPVTADPELADTLAAAAQARIAVDRAFADANSGVAGFATLLAMAGLSAPFRIKSDEPGLIYDAQAGWVGSMDPDGDLPADLAHAQAKLVAGALNAAAGFGPPVRVNDDLPEDLAASPLGALHNAAKAVRDWMLESYDALNGAAGSSEIYRRLSDALSRSAHHARQPEPAEPVAAGTSNEGEAA